MSHWTNVTVSPATGNTSLFIAAKGIVVERAGNDANEIDFNNTFCSSAPFIFTAVDPIAFSSTNRNDPA